MTERVWEVVTGCFVLLVLWMAEKAESSRVGPTVTAESVGPTWIALRIRDPAEGYPGLQVLSYTIRFGSGHDRATQFELKRRQDEENGTVINVEELEPRTRYEFRITPHLADGTPGPATAFVQRTAVYERPQAVTVTSDRRGHHPHSYTLTWHAPFYSGGHRILGYDIKYARADEVDRSAEPWRAVSVTSNMTSILVFGELDTRVTLRPLKADTYYAVTIHTIGHANDHSKGKDFVFKTAGDASCGVRERPVHVFITGLAVIVATSSPLLYP